MQADAIFVNGPIISVDPAHPAPQAVAVLANRIVGVGSRDDILTFCGPQTRVIDLGGRCLLPSLNDNHNHPMAFGESLSQIDATPASAPTLAALQDAFRSRSREQHGEGWLIARGYADSRLDIHRHPTRYELDEATGGQPAILVRTCGHLCVANSAALRIGGVTRDTPNPSGGQIDRDDRGEPIGLLRETAQSLVRSHIPPAS
ncbi:MAG: amidohydrolase family protein, partial [Thermomicrobiales bacterium]